MVPCNGVKPCVQHPEREPAWVQIMADLNDAEAFYRGLDRRRPDQDRVWDEILRILYC